MVMMMTMDGWEPVPSCICVRSPSTYNLTYLIYIDLPLTRSHQYCWPLDYIVLGSIIVY
jgi:hypothetical protein